MKQAIPLMLCNCVYVNEGVVCIGLLRRSMGRINRSHPFFNDKEHNRVVRYVLEAALLGE